MNWKFRNTFPIRFTISKSNWECISKFPIHLAEVFKYHYEKNCYNFWKNRTEKDLDPNRWVKWRDLEKFDISKFISYVDSGEHPMPFRIWVENRHICTLPIATEHKYMLVDIEREWLDENDRIFRHYHFNPNLPDMNRYLKIRHLRNWICLGC